MNSRDVARGRIEGGGGESIPTREALNTWREVQVD